MQAPNPSPWPVRLLCLTATTLLAAGCQTSSPAVSWDHVDGAVAVMEPTEDHDSEVRGTVQFLQLEDGVKVVADLEGLPPNSTHAIHVHEYGDVRAPDGTRAGVHYNPEGHSHDLPGYMARHAGDLGNLESDGDGNAHYELVVHNMTVAGVYNPVIGRSVIVHAKADSGQGPSGEAGARIAQGVIGITNPGHR